MDSKMSKDEIQDKVRRYMNEKDLTTLSGEDIKDMLRYVKQPGKRSPESIFEERRYVTKGT
jgi:hypothetical protein